MADKPKTKLAGKKLAIVCATARIQEVMNMPPGQHRSALAAEMAGDLMNGDVVIMRQIICNCGSVFCRNGQYEIGVYQNPMGGFQTGGLI